LDPDRLKSIRKWSNGLKLDFKNPKLLNQALTHSSYSNEIGNQIPDNQRLEYLGDSVLGLAINEYLYNRFPSSNEGQLARMKSALVSESALARAAKKIDLGSMLLMGRGEKSSGGAQRPSSLADALEAVIAAVYLDRGLKSSESFILMIMKDQLKELSDPRNVSDPKSRLQENVQKKSKVPPVYEILSESGPDHRKSFVCRVMVNGHEMGRGEGPSRKRAEQEAAREALSRM
jgi:ribonuclease-3